MKKRKLRYDYDAIQFFYDQGHTMREVSEHFGIRLQSLQHAVKQGFFKTRSPSDAAKLKFEKLKKEISNEKDT